MRTGGGRRKLAFRNDTNDEDSLAGFDLVAGGEHGLLNLCTVELRAVGASFVDDAATVRAALYGEVNAGHVIVVGNCELSAVGSAADEELLADWKRNLPTCEWSGFHFEEYGHSERLQRDLAKIPRRIRAVSLYYQSVVLARAISDMHLRQGVATSGKTKRAPVQSPIILQTLRLVLQTGNNRVGVHAIAPSYRERETLNRGVDPNA
jgi:hypothetical protein